MTARKADQVDPLWIYHDGADVWIEPIAGRAYNRFGRRLGAFSSRPYVKISKGSRQFYLHRLVYEAVWGPIPAGLQINHLNGDQRDNRVDNLEAVTQRENVQHAMRTGLSPRGARCPWARLTEAQVIEIRATVGVVSVGEWAKRLGVRSSTVSLARSGKNWSHIGEQEMREYGAAKAADENLSRLMAVSRLGGC